MTAALLFALVPTPDGSCAALLEIDGEPIVHRLASQLVRHHVDDVAVVTAPDWADGVAEALHDLPATVQGVEPARVGWVLDEYVHRVDDRVVIGHADIVAHDGLVAGLLEDPRVRSGILSSAGRLTGDVFRVKLQQGRVISAESGFHAVTDATTNFLSMLVVHRDDRHHLLAAIDELRPLVTGPRPVGWDAELGRKIEVWGTAFTVANAERYHLADQLDRLGPGPDWQPSSEPIRAELDLGFHEAVLARGSRAEHDFVALTLVALTRTPITLRSAYRRRLYWRRPTSAAEALDAEHQLRRIDEDRELLDSSVKADDGFFTTFFVSPYSRYIARWAAHRGLTPNQVTTFSLLLGVLSAIAFSAGERSWDVVGAVLLLVSFTFDCVDGQLARFTRRFSALGAWLDSMFDRAKEAAVFVGLAFGALARGEDVWHLAVAALAFQAVRHHLDFSWAALRHVEIAAVELAPLAEPRDTSRAPEPRTWPPAPREPTAQPAGGTPGGRVAREPARNVSATPSLSARVRRLTFRAIETLGRAGTRAMRFTRGSRVAHWSKRMIVFPIGERVALISVCAVIGGPRLVFHALIAWGALATLYVVAGRTVRSV